MREQLIALWDAIARQDAATMRTFFAPGAVIRWHCTNEQFIVEEYIRANCEYPGDWRGEVEHLEALGDTAVLAARVWLADGSGSFHCAAFYRFKDGKIVSADEYWGDDGQAPQWRLEKHIGTSIVKAISARTERLCITPRSIEEMCVLRGSENDGEMKKAYEEMIAEMRKLPGREEWGAEWRIALADGTTVGGIGFKGPPDKDGLVEVGYGIDEAHQRKGYATEAVKGVVQWALEQSGVKCVTAQTEPDNEISQRVLLNCGFARDGFGEEGPMYKITG